MTTRRSAIDIVEFRARTMAAVRQHFVEFVDHIGPYSEYPTEDWSWRDFELKQKALWEHYGGIVMGEMMRELRES